MSRTSTAWTESWRRWKQAQRVRKAAVRVKDAQAAAEAIAIAIAGVVAADVVPAADREVTAVATPAAEAVAEEGKS
jgi:hypothetical protein